MKIVKTEDVNTNNAWGFGGKAGKLTTYDNGIEVFSGRLYHRHAPPSVCNYVSIEVRPKFSIGLRTVRGAHIASIEGVKAISIFSSEHGSHWQAIAEDLDQFEMYGENYVLVKKINVL